MGTPLGPKYVYIYIYINLNLMLCSYMGPWDCCGAFSLALRALALRLRCNSMGGFPEIRGYFFGGAYNQDSSVLGSVLGFPYSWKLSYDLLSTLAS